MSKTSLEVSARSVEEAIEKGLAQLGLPRDQVDIQVLRGASRGILGLGGEDAIVRLTPRTQVEMPEETPGPVLAPRPTESGAFEEPAPVPEPGAARQPGAEPAAVGQQALERLLRDVGLSARVQVLRDVVSADERAFVLNIVGDDLGILIGRRGETLRDLEYLTRLIVAQITGKQAKLVVDVEGYRTRRERVLNELAKRMADRVQANHQPITLEAMPPNERRIVHLALRDHPSVTTQSIGEGEHRRVMIIPK
jgi:spoIIIJ-associated protein